MRSLDSRRGGILFGLLLSGLVMMGLVIACGIFLARKHQGSNGRQKNGG